MRAPCLSKRSNSFPTAIQISCVVESMPSALICILRAADYRSSRRRFVMGRGGREFVESDLIAREAEAIESSHRRLGQERKT